MLRSCCAAGMALLLPWVIGCADVEDRGPAPAASIPSKPTASLPNLDTAPVPVDSNDLGWHFFRGNAESTGVATTTLPNDLQVVWEHQVKNGAFEGSPVIVGGDHPRAYLGDADGTLFAFDLDSGNVIWKFQSEIGFLTAPAFVDGNLYIGDMDGMFYCVDESGAERWRFVAESTIDSSANFFGDNVLFGSRDTRLYAINRNSGEKVWQLETADEVRCGITVIEGKAFVAGCDGALHVIDLETGTETGSVMIDSPTGVTPAAVGELVFVGTEQAGIFAIDWKRSEKQWTFNADEATISTRSSPAVFNNHVVFGARDRTVYSIDPITGGENWRTELKANIDSSPVIVGDSVFVGSTDGRFYQLQLESGEVVWQQQFNGGFIGSPAVAFGRLVIATDRGVVYCLGKRSRLSDTDPLD